MIWIVLEGFTGLIGFISLNQVLGSSYVAIICIGITINIMQQKQYKIRCLFDFTKMKEYIYVNQWLFLCAICMLCHMFRRGLLAAVCLCMTISIFLFALYKKAKILEYKIIQLMGMISYLLYLIHQNMAYLIEFNLAEKYNQMSLNLIAGGIFSCLVTRNRIILLS